MKKLLDLSKISGSIKSFRSSIFESKKTTSNMRNILIKKTKVKKESIQGKKVFWGRKKEYERRRENEAALEAKDIIATPIKAVVKATGGFLSRILSFLGTLLLGWLMNNLPTIIAMAQELIARIQRMFALLQGFIGNIFNIVKNFGSLLNSVFQDIISLDFLDTSNRVKTSFTNLENTFTDMGKQIDEGVRLATTSLNESIAPGGPGEIPAAGTDYTQTPYSADSPSGYATAGLSGVSQQRIGNDIEFLKEVKRVSQKYGLKEGDLLGLIASESGFNPAADNGTHVGLIQFSADSAKSVGTSQAALKRMSRAQQMKYVDKYFENWNLPKGANAGQLYSVVFAPAYASGDPNKVLYSSPSREYSSNKPLDTNKDGKITISEMGGRIQQKKKEFGISDNIQVTETQITGTGSSGSSSAIASAAKSLKGMDTSSGPGGGSVSCVYAVNKVFAKAGIPTPWGGAQSTDQVIYGLKRNKWTQVSTKDARAGDVWVYDANDGRRGHVGIMMDNGRVLSNSSTRAKFVWEATPQELLGQYPASGMTPPGGAFYRMPGSTSQTRPTPAPITPAPKTAAPVSTAQTTPTTTAAPAAPSITPTSSVASVVPEAQVSSTQLSQQVAQTIQTSTTPEQQTIFINDVQQPQPVVASSGGGGASAPPSISSLTLLNRFMKHHILLDLAYT